MSEKKYSTVCRLLFPQPEDAGAYRVNERTQVFGDMCITDDGCLYSCCDGGTAIFRSPTTPRLEYLSALDGDAFIEILYIGKLNIQLWAYPPNQSGLLLEEQPYSSIVPEKVYIKVPLEVCSEGYFDIHGYFGSEGSIFSMAVVSDIDFQNYNDITLTKLANFIFPQKNICTAEQLYFRMCNDAGSYSYIERNITLFPRKTLEFSTYFNAFSCGKWFSHTTIEDICININFIGTCIIEIWHALAEDRQYKVYADVHKHSVWGEARIRIGKSSVFESGILYIKVHALSRTQIGGASYATSTPKTADVRLGIVITTYKREEDVKKSVATLGAALPSVLREQPVEIVVVDNGRTLQPEDVPGATLIPNRNLGGSGGFMRGLIHLEDEGRFTHCLFMDDDAFCEPESVARTWALLSYRREDNLAVAGAMLLKEHMHIQHENGAYFDYINHPINSGFDLNIRAIVMQNEQTVYYNNMYGAWWFFAFSISCVKRYAFPFFVRGDDILFSLMNSFSILTLNGICSWQENFSNKNSPITRYLETRSLFIINCIKNNYFKCKFYIFINVMCSILKYALSYNYDSANAMLHAVFDFLSGPDFWKNNVDMYNVRKNICNSIKFEKYIKYFDEKDVCEYVHPERRIKNNYFNAVVIISTFCGHIFPNMLIDNCKKYFIYYNERTYLSYIYKKKYITVYNDVKKAAYELEKNNILFFRIMFDCVIAVVKFIFSNKTYKKYHKNINILTSKSFWKNIFCEKTNTIEKVIK